MDRPKQLSDAQLLLGIANSQEAAFQELFLRYKDVFYSTIYKITGDAQTAQDAVQELFIKLWTGRHNLDKVENPAAYLHQACANQARSVLKANKSRELRMHQYLHVPSTNTHHDAEDQLIKHEWEARISQAVDKLPPQQKRVYELNRVQGLKNDEIAAMLGLSVTTVKNHLTRALHHLKEELGDNPQTLAIILMMQAII